MTSRKFFGFLEPPCHCPSHTTCQYYRHVLDNPPPPLMRDVIYGWSPGAPTRACGQRRGEDLHQKIKVSEILRGHISPFPSLLWLWAAFVLERMQGCTYKISDCAFKEMNGGSRAGAGRSHRFRTIWSPSFSIPSGRCRCSGCRNRRNPAISPTLTRTRRSKRRVIHQVRALSLSLLSRALSRAAAMHGRGRSQFHSTLPAPLRRRSPSPTRPTPKPQ